MRKWNQRSKKAEGWVERRRRFRRMLAGLRERLGVAVVPQVPKVAVEKAPAK